MNAETHESYAVKIIKNLPAYNRQAENEKEFLLAVCE
jgi:hypothetical protein